MDSAVEAIRPFSLQNIFLQFALLDKCELLKQTREGQELDHHVLHDHRKEVKLLCQARILPAFYFLEKNISKIFQLK